MAIICHLQDIWLNCTTAQYINACIFQRNEKLVNYLPLRNSILLLGMSKLATGITTFNVQQFMAFVSFFHNKTGLYSCVFVKKMPHSWFSRKFWIFAFWTAFLRSKLANEKHFFLYLTFSKYTITLSSP